MDWLLKLAWLALALVHVAPAAAAFAPALLERLYGVQPTGEVGVLLTHRGALFLAVTLAAAFAAFDPPSRRLATIVCGVSIVSFLLIYWRAGAPPGSLRTIALFDLAALAPLAFAALHAWRPQAS